MQVRCLHARTFSLGLVAGDILAGVTETGRGKQTLWENEKQIRRDTETQVAKKKRTYVFFT